MTMKVYAYIYTRTMHIDYNVFAMPSTLTLPSSIAEDFEKKISGILNVDDQEELIVPQYVYVRNSNVVLWGTAILNNVLFGNSEYSKDHVARPIRSFIGIILTDPSPAISLPMDMDFFAQLYQEQIFPLWKNRFLEPQEAEISLPSNGAYLTPKSNVDINKDKDVLRVYNGSEFSEQVLAACLAYDGDVSVATNVYSIDRVSMPRFNPFTNVVLSQENETTTEDIHVYHVCPNCQREVPYSEIQGEYCSSCRPHCEIEEEEYEEATEEVLNKCCKCHGIYDSLDSNGYCDSCSKKKKFKRYLWITAIILSLLFIFKDCKGINSRLSRIDIPSLVSHKSDEVKKQEDNEYSKWKGYKQDYNTINKKQKQLK